MYAQNIHVFKGTQSVIVHAEEFKRKFKYLSLGTAVSYGNLDIDKIGISLRQMGHSSSDTTMIRQ